ncbi:MAG: ferrous iron transporter B [Deltaproteobacteria bacterium]|nr:ferrous iron transporter B [Deltaproteobacteria bacterium]
MTTLRATALFVGRPNVGKSSLFNTVTGAQARVGNFPGITVDVLEATVRIEGQGELTLVDLPGVYSLARAETEQSEEQITSNFIDQSLRESKDRAVVLQVLDGTQLSLSLQLTRELAARLAGVGRLGLVINQADELTREGRTLDTEALAQELGIPVLLVSARDALARDQVIHFAFKIADHSLVSPLPEALDTEALARRVLRDTAALSDTTQRARTRTERIDRWVLHPWLGPLLFVSVLAVLFAAVFLVADPTTTLIDACNKRLGAWLTPRLGGGFFASFIADGLLGGAGTVLAFLPQIVVLTLVLELLDASGYLTRGVFLVDRAMRKVGLGGMSLVPLLTAHACAVPAIRSTRILRDPRERLITLLVLPLMTCSARLPTYALLISTFFAHRSPWIRSLLFLALYAAGWVAGVLAAAALRKTVVRGRPLPLLLEMPAYRAPERSFVRKATQRAVKSFLRDVGTTIVVASAALWLLLNVPMPGAAMAPSDAPANVQRVQRSVAASMGRALEPITRPLGFDWRINVGLMGSFGARELMVGTLGVIYGLEDVDDNTTPLRAQLRQARDPQGRPRYDGRMALALMAFFVVACQCMSTVAALRRETGGWRWPLFVLGYTYSLGYLLALCVYQIATWLHVS